MNVPVLCRKVCVAVEKPMGMGTAIRLIMGMGIMQRD